MTVAALITGITGQDGSYLSELLLAKGYVVCGIVRRNSQLYQFRTIDHIKDKLRLVYGDMTDATSLHSIIHSIFEQQDSLERLEIYNLAAQSHVKISFEVPEYAANTDALGVLYLLQIIASLPKERRDLVRFYQAGTSELYGAVLETQPDAESISYIKESATPFGAVGGAGLDASESHAVATQVVTFEAICFAFVLGIAAVVCRQRLRGRKARLAEKGLLPGPHAAGEPPR